MTPQEKAHKLVDKFYSEICHLIPVEDGNERSQRFRIIKPIAKQSALIAVNEILKTIWEYHFQYDYWQEVKQEIEQL